MTSYRLTIEFDSDATEDDLNEIAVAAVTQIIEAVVIEEDGNERSIDTSVREWTLDATHIATPPK